MADHKQESLQHTDHDYLEYREKVRQAESRRLQLEKQIDDLEEKAGLLSEKNRSDSESHAREIKSLEERLTHDAAEASLIMGQLQNTIDALESDLARTSQTLVIRNDENERLSRDLGDAHAQLQSALMHAQDVQERLESSKRQYQDLSAHHKQGQSILKETLKDRDETHLAFATLKENHATQATEIEDNRKTVTALREKINDYHHALIRAEQRNSDLQKTLSFQLGSTLNEAFKNWQNTLSLPGDLIRLRREAKRRRVRRTTGQSSLSQAQKESLGPAFQAELESILRERGIEAAATYAREKAKNPDDLASAFTRLAKSCIEVDAEAALSLAREAVTLSPRPFRKKWLAFLLFDAGIITEAQEILSSLPADTGFQASERNKAHYIAGCYRLLVNPLLLPPRRHHPAYESSPSRVLYIAASTLPFHVSGYTMRTHQIVKTMTAKGWDVTCTARPGYPADRNDALAQPDPDGQIVYDNIVYHTLAGPHRKKTGLDDYIMKAADIIAEQAKLYRASIIHAASNYESALPALIAARKMGIPFIYEVRGLWEYTTASRIPGWEKSERFALDKKLESLTASHADHVLTLTAALADELSARGAEAEKISLIPNAIDPASHAVMERCPRLAASLGLREDAFVAGYIGSVVAYEGLDDLVTACAKLKEAGDKLQVLIVGDGTALPALRAQVSHMNLQNDVIFTGRVAPEDVPLYFAQMDAMTLPRKPATVCEIVSPLKPFEAMAMKVPLLVSDVSALKEIVEDGKTGFLHKAGDAEALALGLKRIMKDRDAAKRMAETAYAHVMIRHTWDAVTMPIGEIYARLSNAPATARDNPPEEDQPPFAVEPVFLPPGKNSLTEDQKSILDSRMNQALAAGGADGLDIFLLNQIRDRSDKFSAFCLTKAADILLSHGNISEAIRMARKALDLDFSLTTVRSVCRFYSHAGLVEDAKDMALHLQSLTDASHAGDGRIIADALGRADLVNWASLPAATRSSPAIPGRVLNILSFSLPYASVGYATRSHGLALGIRNAGWDIRPYTRPGFPHDYKNQWQDEALPETDEIDGLVYHRLFDLVRKNQDEISYILECIAVWERIIDEERPELVHAASNYVTALPALIAARRKGVPFLYEIRGFWEITRSSRDQDFINTPKYRHMELFESLLSRHADHVVTITTEMKNELTARGVRPENITIAYNSVDAERFVPRPRDAALAEKMGIPDGVPVIGYVGSFVDYEGLDDLITACAGLNHEGLDFRLLLVGDGAVKDELEQKISAMGLQDKAILTGRIPHEDVEDYYTLIDIAPFPRKPWPVCEMVSPLKPFEAMALEKAVVVSSTKALLEIVTHESTGLVFEKGNIASQQEALARLIKDSALRAKLGKEARHWIERERSWNKAAQAVDAAYSLVRNIYQL